MNSWAIVAIVAIVASAITRMIAGRRCDRRSAGNGPAHIEQRDDAEKIMLKREVEELRDRVKVLERIATDANSSHAISSRAISDEIEKLRDHKG